MDDEEKDDEITRLRSLLNTTERDKRKIERELTASRTKEEESAAALAEEERKVVELKRIADGLRDMTTHETFPDGTKIDRKQKSYRVSAILAQMALGKFMPTKERWLWRKRIIQCNTMLGVRIY